MNVEIVPHASGRLRSRPFENVGTLNQLPELIERAKREMGLTDSEDTQNFSRDVLKIVVEKLDVLPLTLVDLPGVISHGDEADMKLVMDIVNEWIGKPGSIILVVVDASADSNNWGIMPIVAKADPQGQRSFGIITKPDLANSTQGLSEHCINIARNGVKNSKFEKGWHVLKNRPTKTGSSVANRDLEEIQFFKDAENPWSQIPEKDWGIENLNLRLSRLLEEDTSRQLESVQRNIDRKLNEHDRQLRGLKKMVQGDENMWKLFEDKCDKIIKLVLMATEGNYNHPFFTNRDQRYRLRDGIRKAHTRFGELMESEGHSRRFAEDPEKGALDTDRCVDEVMTVLRNTEGNEHVGQYRPQLLNLLFWDHSKAWPDIAGTHIQNCFQHCREFVEALIKSQLSNEFPGLPQKLKDKIQEKLKGRMENAWKELDKLEIDRERTTKTGNKDWVTQSQQLSSKEAFSLVNKVTLQAQKKGTSSLFTANIVANYLDINNPSQGDRRQAQQLLKEMQVIYNVGIADPIIDMLADDVTDITDSLHRQRHSPGC